MRMAIIVLGIGVLALGVACGGTPATDEECAAWVRRAMSSLPEHVLQRQNVSRADGRCYMLTYRVVGDRTVETLTRVSTNGVRPRATRVVYKEKQEVCFWYSNFFDSSTVISRDDYDREVHRSLDTENSGHE